MKYPKLLSKGDTIGVCAPSLGIPEAQFHRLETAISNVEKLGYKVQITPSVKSIAKCVSADPKTRAAEFMSLYENPDAAAIIPIWGGEFLMDMLPYLDFERISLLPPKWVSGYSDVTTLLFPLTLLCDIAAIHGSNFMNMGYDEIQESDLKVFAAMSQSGIIQHSSEKWGRQPSFDDTTLPHYNLTSETKWKSLYSEKDCTFEGRMIGGCLDVLCKLVGTKYAPVPAFLERYRDDGFIWSIESCEMSAADIYRTLWQMRECGWFNYCRGILMGRPEGYSDTFDFTKEDAMKNTFDGMGVPVIYDADIGHTPPQMQMINGAMTLVEYEDGHAVVTQKYI